MFMSTRNQFCNVSLQERKSYLEKGWEAVVGEGIGRNGDWEIYSEQKMNNEGADIGDEYFEVDPDAQDLASLNHLLEMESRSSNKHLKGQSGLLKTNDLPVFANSRPRYSQS
jgi:hypothetical protein